MEILNKNSVHFDELGIVTEKDMIIDDKLKIRSEELILSDIKWLKNYMST